MLTIDNYIDLARAHSKLASDRQLAFALKLSPAAPSFWRQKKSWPNDESMIRLARLAGEDELLALLHLNSWRASGKAATIYLDLARRVSALSIAAFFLILSFVNTSPASAGTGGTVPFSNGTLYIMENIMTWLRGCFGLPFRPRPA